MDSDKEFTDTCACAMTPGECDIVLTRIHVDVSGASVRELSIGGPEHKGFYEAAGTAGFWINGKGVDSLITKIRQK